MIVGKISVCITKRSAKQRIKHWNKRFLKEFKATCKNSGESEVNNKKRFEMRSKSVKGEVSREFDVI